MTDFHPSDSGEHLDQQAPATARSPTGGVQVLVSNNPDLESLAIHGNDSVQTRQTIAPLRDAKKLKRLQLSGHQLTAEGVSVLRQLPRLGFVEVYGPVPPWLDQSRGRALRFGRGSESGRRGRLARHKEQIPD